MANFTLLKILISYVVGIAVFFFYKGIIEGNLFRMYPSNSFNDTISYDFWLNITSTHRHVFSPEYEMAMDNLYSKLLALPKNNQNIQVDIFKEINSISKTLKYNSVLNNVQNIIVKITPNGDYSKNTPLLICAHMDGHALQGGTAYDDAIHCAAMFGCIENILSSNFEVKCPIYFLFDGSEEFGLHGASNFVNNHPDIKFDYFNLESMGSSTPILLFTKNLKHSRRVQSAFAKAIGAVCITVGNDLYNSGITDSSSDDAVFNKAGYPGAMAVFLGEGTHYHTKYDKIKNSAHLRIIGHQLLQFIHKYNPTISDYNVASYGISPIVLVFPNVALYILIPIFFVGSGVVIFFLRKGQLKKAAISCLKGFGTIIIVFIIFILFSCMIYGVNTCSYVPYSSLIILITFSGLCLFYLFTMIFKNIDWPLIRLILDCLLAIISIKLDVALPLLCITIESLVLFVWENQIWRWAMYVVQCFTMSLMYAVFIPLFYQYSSRFENITSDIVPFLILFCFVVHLSLGALSLSIPYENKPIRTDSNITLYNELSDENRFHSGTNQEEEEVPFYKQKDLIFSIVFPVLVLIIIFLLPYPYSIEYTVRGCFREIFYENGEAQLSLSPSKLQTVKYLKKFARDTSIEYLKNYPIPGRTFNSFVMNLSNPELPDYVFPKSSQISIQRNLNEVTFQMDLPEKTASTYLIINCKDCVKSAETINNPITYKDKFFFFFKGFTDQIRYNLTITKGDYSAEVVYMTLDKTSQLKNFEKMFGDATVQSYSAAGLADTLYWINKPLP